MFVVRKIISSKFKHNGQNIWQKLGWVSLHSQTSIRPDYNELRLGRAQLIKMVDTVMKAFVVKKVGHRLRNICNAMQWTWHMTLLMTVGQKWPDPVWWEWTESRERGLAVAVPSFSRVSGELPGAQLHGPGPTTVYQKISWHRLQDQDTRLCIHSNSSKDASSSASVRASLILQCQKS